MQATTRINNNFLIFINFANKKTIYFPLVIRINYQSTKKPVNLTSLGKITALCLLLLAGTIMCAQDKRFDQDVLDNPTKDRKKLESLFKTLETKKVNPKAQKGAVALENGYATYKIKDAEAWEKIRDKNVATQIEVVYTKYPKDLEFWLTPYHELLANRLKALFEVDPSLNDKNIKFYVVLQTQCDNDEQARKMWHGILIRYRPMTAQELKNRKEEMADGADGEKEEPGMPGGFSSVRRFIKNVGGMYDSVIYKVLDRNTQWQKALLVSDWTGSNYQYAVQGIYWHMLNMNKSGVKYFSFFNDGDGKSEFDKKVGEAGGLYFADGAKTNKVVSAFNTSMRRGMGGEIPENDIEAIIKSIDAYPDAEVVILVADNSPFRDFELIEQIKVPVHIILQGAEWGINPQYVNLAYLTGGSLHTLKKDYTAEFFAKGDTLINIDGHRFSLNQAHNLYQCQNRRICEDLEAIINQKEEEALAELKTKPAYRGMHKDKKVSGFNKFLHWIFGG
ncbi:MAG TPA: hypothetical protein VEC12_11715 [Bacteroidia bacterium]|nr:hypothetical protein [Bacteroidia bacterium]